MLNTHYTSFILKYFVRSCSCAKKIKNLDKIVAYLPITFSIVIGGIEGSEVAFY